MPVPCDVTLSARLEGGDGGGISSAGGTCPSKLLMPNLALTSALPTCHSVALCLSGTLLSKERMLHKAENAPVSAGQPAKPATK